MLVIKSQLDTQQKRSKRVNFINPFFIFYEGNKKEENLMDFWTELLLSALGILVTGLATWLTTAIVNWFNTKIKNKKLVELLTAITNTVAIAVRATYQEYVENIKGTDMWDKEAQKEALKKALETAKATLSSEAMKYITENYDDIDAFLTSLIESILFDLKAGKLAATTLA